MTVVQNADQSRYEIHVDGELAGFARYRRLDAGVDFVHTEIDPKFEGRGLGSQLAKGALDDVRSKGERIIATCSFIAGYIERHPEYST